MTGNVYADSSNINWLARKSSDGGATWTTVQNFAYGDSDHPNYNSSSGQATGVVVDTNGVVYIFSDDQSENDSGANSDSRDIYWVIRASIDDGVSWSTIERFN